MGSPLRIAQVSPLIESVPPKGYGGVERVVSYLTEELVRQEHDVTLFASGDSTTTARLVATCERSLRASAVYNDHWPYHLQLVEHVMRMSDEFDVIHFHTEGAHFPAARRTPVAILTTVHGRLDWADIQGLYREFNDLPLVSVSSAQRNPMPQLNWVGTVHHGVPEQLYLPRDGRGKYLAFLGRISPEKRPDRAIQIANAAGMRLKIAAKVDRVDVEYFERVIQPLLSDQSVEYIGEIGDSDKSAFLGDAYALLFPIDWEEPFGLATIEAMACGTPVIAYRRGATAEIVDEGKTGFVVDDEEGALRAVRQVPRLVRSEVRRVFEERFSARRMAQEYVHIYEHLIKKCNTPNT